MASTRDRGHSAERIARYYLEDRGLRFRAANVAARRGEIDLVMDDGGVLVFVEVRMRGRSRWGGGAESVTTTKQRRLIHAAQHYLQRTGLDRPCRFDVVALEGDGAIEWIADAFQAPP